MSELALQLSRGMVARISEGDAERVLRHRWHAHPARHTNYAAGYVQGKTVYLHRFLTGATGRFDFVDHIDRDGLNNTRENLRICTPAQNLANRTYRDSRSGRRGVRLTTAGMWEAQIKRDGTLIYLGSFATEHEAGIAYDAAFLIIHGFKVPQ